MNSVTPNLLGTPSSKRNSMPPRSSIEKLPDFVSTFGSSTRKLYYGFAEGYMRWRQGEPDGARVARECDGLLPGNGRRRFFTEPMVNLQGFTSAYFLGFRPDLEASSKMSFWSTVLTIVISVLGTGPVVMPRCFALAGYIGGTFSLLFVVVLITFMGIFLSKALTLAEEDGPPITRLQDLARKALGPFGPFGHSLIFLSTFGAITAFTCTFLSVQSTQLQNIVSILIPQVLTAWSYPLILVFMFFVYFFVTEWSYGKTSFQGLTRLATCFLLVCLIFLYGIPIQFSLREEFVPESFQAFNFEGDFSQIFFRYIEILVLGVFSFAVVVTFPGVRSCMADPKDFPKALSTGMAFAFTIYVSLFSSAYYAYGTEIKKVYLDNVRTSESRWAGVVCVLCYVAYCLVTASMFLVIIIKAVTGVMPSVNQPMNRRLFLGVYLLVCLVTIYFIPHIGIIVTISGSVFCVANNIVVPGLAYGILNQPVNRKSHCLTWPEIPTYEGCILCMALIVGLVVFGFGEYSGIQELYSTLKS